MSSNALNEQPLYYQGVALKAAADPRESIVYAVLIEFLALHKDPPWRFILYPQMSLKWKPQDPQDLRQEITDLGIINITPEAFKLRCGVEAKHATPIMAQLPNAKYIQHNLEVRDAFFAAYCQAADQAKAAFKNNYCLDSEHPIDWMLVVGPYWTPVELGPFSEAQLTVRTHKQSSSEDFEGRLDLELFLEQPPPELLELYCFNSQSSFERIEEILNETAAAAEPLINVII
jgi:hypothetical protein